MATSLEQSWVHEISCIQKNPNGYWEHLLNLVQIGHEIGLTVENKAFAKLIGIADEFEGIPKSGSEDLYSADYKNRKKKDLDSLEAEYRDSVLKLIQGIEIV
ncbi:MAG: hypothetical protein COU35_03665 [Candidatus Magasanikbacteria bacterium CG10_big_fil_rev_8_21_14_0_10_47_10]|uniref:Uncharacterized protein n=1 Tax=Candidatus Magasanikbacteria bacterium CG10_big_fil_rev_8_21_14_0_10_47_10 TaxID=1974652 RepID=A0A2H0TPZ4_9BACT|nr:MAG: hypothetical protein COU35_03665 [Candidatus Magasanikbacteria bacterium CG10_big_fil_rev_8_21_14_0_10_47_10]